MRSKKKRKSKVYQSILKLLAREETVSFKKLFHEFKVSQSTLYYRLEKLEKMGYIKKIGRGSYTLARKTPLAFLSPTTPKAYIGLLGLKNSREEPEWYTAIKRLKEENMIFDKIIVITSPPALSTWNTTNLKVSWRLFSEEDLFKPSEISKSLKEIVNEIFKDYATLIDITSGPRVAGLMLYEIATIECVPVIYLREDTKEIIWIKTVEDAIKCYLNKIPY